MQENSNIKKTVISTHKNHNLILHNHTVRKYRLSKQKKNIVYGLQNIAR